MRFVYCYLYYDRDHVDTGVVCIMCVMCNKYLTLSVHAREGYCTIEPQSYGRHSYGILCQPDTDIEYIFGMYHQISIKWNGSSILAQ